ncbi:MAG: AAA family ATPase, partial [Myxococcaceae bacterium]
PKLKSHLYLQGPPGVGKTEAVFKLGKALGIPIIKINLAEFSNIGKIKGIAGSFQDDDHGSIGVIVKSIIAHSKTGYQFKNAILFFDEADQVLNRIHEGESHELVSFMLDLLEGKTQFIENPYLETDLDIRHFGIILAGNNPLHNKALQSRLNTLIFGSYQEAYRIKAGRERFLPEILSDYSEVLTLKDFTEQDFEAIDNIARAEHKKLIDEKEDPGFRNQIREIERFVHRKANSKSG